MAIGIVIPCRNEAAHVTDVLDALASQDRQADDVVVVDDGSTDATAAVVGEWCRQHACPPVRVIAGPGRGVAAAVNAGVAALSTDVVARLDGHCRPASDYLQRAAALVEAADVGVAGGVWVIEPGAPTLEAEAIAIAVGHAFGSGGAQYRQAQDHTRHSRSYVAADLQVGRSDRPEGSDRRNGRPEGRPLRTIVDADGDAEATSRDVDTVPFGCFRRALWAELGGLDERLRSNEDYEFNYRVRQRGLRVVLDPAIRCTYYARPTMDGLARQYGRYGWWKAQMLVSHPGAIRGRQLIAALVAPSLLTLVLGALLVGGPAWGVLLAMYPIALLAGAIHAAATRRRWIATMWIVSAFAHMQIAWSVAFWCSLAAAVVSGGKRRA